MLPKYAETDMYGFCAVGPQASEGQFSQQSMSHWEVHRAHVVSYKDTESTCSQAGAQDGTLAGHAAPKQGLIQGFPPCKLFCHFKGIKILRLHFLPQALTAQICYNCGFSSGLLAGGASLEQASQPSVQDLEQNWEDVRSCKNGERTGLQQSHCLAPFAGCKKHCRPPIGAQNAALACLLHAASKPGPNQTLPGNKPFSHCE